MPSPLLRSAMRFGIGVGVIALTMSLVVRAECVTVTLKKGEKYKGPVAHPALVFSGTVTATNIEKYTVSLEVDRVWKGQLHRETTLFVVPAVEGIGASFFQTGAAYLVTAYPPITVFGPEDFGTTGLRAVTLGVVFGCDSPVPLEDASEWLKHLGRGRAPRP